MKKLLIATDNYLPRWDGIARFLSEIIPRLINNYEITVVAPDFGVFEDPNIKLVKIPLSKIFKVGDFQVPAFKRGTIHKLVMENDIIFTQTIGPIGMLAIREAKIHKKPVAAFIHSIEWELVPKAIQNIFLKRYSQFLAKRTAKKLYNKCSLLIMPAQNVADLFLWNNIRARYEIVNLGVDVAKFIPNPSAKAELRAQLGFSANDIIIGYHGRISREKDLITLLRAYLRVQNYHENIKLLIVGEGVASIKKQLTRRGVVLVGAKNNPVPYLQVMDIYCLTSLTETTCLSLLEAMACGLAVVSTEVGFIRSYIRNNHNGLFFAKQSPYPLAKNIELLIKDPELRRRLGENARRTVVERFSWDKTAEGIIKALQSIEKK